MRSKGNIVLAILFIILISITGLSILTSTITHIKISRARIKKAMETGKIHRELIYYLHNFREKIFSQQIHTFDKPEEEYFNKTYFPDYRNNQTKIKNSFEFKEFQKDYYKRIRIMDKIVANSTRTNYLFESGVVVDILSGKIPLSLVTLFLNKKIDIPKNVFIEKNNIKNKSFENIIIDKIEVEYAIKNFLLDSMSIKSGPLSWEKIREKLGLEISDKPVENGVYIVIDGCVVESIFIQGDVDKLIFSILENKQKISIVKKGRTYEIIYIPEENFFLCWDKQIDVCTLFKERIIVNGNIWAVEQSGVSAFIPESNIKLYSSGQTTIKSNLETENSNKKNIKFTNLTLLAGCEAPFDQENLEPEIIVDSKKEIDIQISIISDGKFENTCSRLKIEGSIYCKEFKNKGIMEIKHLKSKFDSGKYFRTGNFKYINNFFVDFIQEAYHE